MYRSLHTHSEDAQLQTDVTRFMAIVAFCLIAILAMVKSVPTASLEMTAAEPMTPSPEPIAYLEKAEPATRVISESEVEKREIEPEPAPDPELEPPPDPVPDMVEEPILELAAVDIAVTKTTTPNQPEPGLVLRFASQDDFLSLIAASKLSVYAYNSNTRFKVTPTFNLNTGSFSGEVYEIAGNTIPAALTHKAARMAGGSSITWAVALPRQVKNRIQHLVDQERSGQLLINRRLEVRHVAHR